MRPDPIGFCNFAQWAWTESTPLIDSLEEETRGVCREMFDKRAELKSIYHRDEVGSITTNALRMHMNETLAHWSESYAAAPTDNADPRYIMLWADTSIMEDLGWILTKNMTA